MPHHLCTYFVETAFPTHQVALTPKWKISFMAIPTDLESILCHEILQALSMARNYFISSKLDALCLYSTAAFAPAAKASQSVADKQIPQTSQGTRGGGLQTKLLTLAKSNTPLSLATTSTAALVKRCVFHRTFTPYALRRLISGLLTLCSRIELVYLTVGVELFARSILSKTHTLTTLSSTNVSKSPTLFPTNLHIQNEYLCSRRIGYGCPYHQSFWFSHHHRFVLSFFEVLKSPNA